MINWKPRVFNQLNGAEYTQIRLETGGEFESLGRVRIRKKKDSKINPHAASIAVTTQ